MGRGTDGAEACTSDAPRDCEARSVEAEAEAACAREAAGAGGGAGGRGGGGRRGFCVGDEGSGIGRIGAVREASPEKVFTWTVLAPAQGVGLGAT